MPRSAAGTRRTRRLSAPQMPTLLPRSRIGAVALRSVRRARGVPGNAWRGGHLDLVRPRRRRQSAPASQLRARLTVSVPARARRPPVGMNRRRASPVARPGLTCASRKVLPESFLMLVVRVRERAHEGVEHEPENEHDEGKRHDQSDGVCGLGEHHGGLRERHAHSCTCHRLVASAFISLCEEAPTYSPAGGGGGGGGGGGSATPSARSLQTRQPEHVGCTRTPVLAVISCPRVWR